MSNIPLDPISGEPRPPTADVAVRRIKTLLHTAPIHELDANKTRRDEDWTPYDVRRLQLAAIEIVVDHMGLAAGAPRSVVRAELIALARRMAPDRDADEHVGVADGVLKFLLNEQDSGAGFEYEYGQEDADGSWTRRRYIVEVLRERQDHEGNLVVRASPEAINMVIGALSMDIADAQKADELVLAEQIADGRLGAAEESAYRARLRSIQYGEELHSVLELAQLDVARLDWAGHVMQVVSAAQTHVRGRLDEETRLRQRLDELQADSEDPEQLALLSRLVELIDDCHRRHTRVHAQLMQATEVFLHEQQRQRFARPASLTAIGLSRELMDPLLQLGGAAAFTVGDVFLRAVVGPWAPALPDLATLLNDLLAPRRELAEELVDIPEVDLDTAASDSRFSPAAILAATRLLGTTRVRHRRLGDLLNAACAVKDAPAREVEDLVWLGAMWAYAPEAADQALTPGGVRSLDDGELLNNPYFGGADLLVGVLPDKEPDAAD